MHRQTERQAFFSELMTEIPWRGFRRSAFCFQPLEQIAVCQKQDSFPNSSGLAGKESDMLRRAVSDPDGHVLDNLLVSAIIIVMS